MYLYACLCIYGEEGSRKIGNVLKSLLTSKIRLANNVAFKRMYFVSLSLKIVVKSESSYNFQANSILPHQHSTVTRYFDFKASVEEADDFCLLGNTNISLP